MLGWSYRRPPTRTTSHLPAEPTHPPIAKSGSDNPHGPRSNANYPCKPSPFAGKSFHFSHHSLGERISPNNHHAAHQSFQPPNLFARIWSFSIILPFLIISWLLEHQLKFLLPLSTCHSAQVKAYISPSQSRQSCSLW